MLECRGPVTVEGSRWKTEAKGRLEKRAIVSSGKENGSEGKVGERGTTEGGEAGWQGPSSQCTPTVPQGLSQL